MDLPPLPLTVLDTETTGFVPRVHRVIEFASVRTGIDGRIVETYEQLVRIPTDIPPAIQTLTRIRPGDLASKPTMDDVRDDLLKHIGEDTLIVGQNVGYDIRMLKGEGIDLSERPWIDTSMLASLLFPELESYSLGFMSRVLDLHHAPMHRALGDVHATLELLERCWQRLRELPEDLLQILRSVMERSTPGYRRLFEYLPPGMARLPPVWLHAALPPPPPRLSEGLTAAGSIPRPETGTVQLIEESVGAASIAALVASALAKTHHTWIVVKNLEQTLQRFTLPPEVQILYPPTTLSDRRAIERLASQQQYTADEATLAVKIAWYEPATKHDLPLHGEETAVWNAKAACSPQSPEYASQFTDMHSVVLLDHRHLLQILADPEHPGQAILQTGPHVIIDDASMLEDTATHALGWHVTIAELRSAAEGNADLTKTTDLLQLLLEQIRNGQDTAFLSPAALHSAECEAVRQRCQMMELTHRCSPSGAYLLELLTILDPTQLPGRIAWIETRQDGGQSLHSVPERVGSALQHLLYDRVPVTLLIPPGSRQTLTEILPRVCTLLQPSPLLKPPELCLRFATDTTLSAVLQSPPTGKTIILVGSKRTIEDMFIAHLERLEEQGITLICQGMSGGMGRMQAEYLATDGPVIWLMTPWAFEGVLLTPQSIDHLILHALPFDHPNHTVLKKRSERYQSAFSDYTLPRLTHRLFRLLRTFSHYQSPQADVVVLDDRIETKQYGREVKAYLQQFSTPVEPPGTSNQFVSKAIGMAAVDPDREKNPQVGKRRKKTAEESGTPSELQPPPIEPTAKATPKAAKKKTRQKMPKKPIGQLSIFGE